VHGPGTDVNFLPGQLDRDSFLRGKIDRSITLVSHGGSNGLVLSSTDLGIFLKWLLIEVNLILFSVHS